MPPTLGSMHVLALAVELRLPVSRSLKAKRAVVKSLTESCHRRFGVSAAETGRQDNHQVAELGFSCVASTVGHCEEVIDRVERQIWAEPDVEVLAATRHWLELDL